MAIPLVGVTKGSSLAGALSARGPVGTTIPLMVRGPAVVAEGGGVMSTPLVDMVVESEKKEVRMVMKMKFK